jgi:hypothetical protein
MALQRRGSFPAAAAAALSVAAAVQEGYDSGAP